MTHKEVPVYYSPSCCHFICQGSKHSIRSFLTHVLKQVRQVSLEEGEDKLVVGLVAYKPVIHTLLILGRLGWLR